MKLKRHLAVAVLLLTAVACSTNPVTHKREFNIVSEQQEIQLGQQQHQEVLKEFSVYDEKPELTRLVNEVGQTLAAKSDRPNLPWHFTILDTPVVNAMALPGGYIYITRGMLERINSRDELAGVLGHEIVHVTARHAAEQISRQQLAQLGLVLGSVIAGPQIAQQYGQLAQLGAQLLFQKYSRSQESQADHFGTIYSARAGYNPIGVERMLMGLQRMDKHPSSGIDKYFESHPDPAKRVRDVTKTVQELASSTPPPNTAEPDRNRYIPLVDGIITANSTEHLVIKGNTIYDREHGMIANVPQGWKPIVEPGLLFGMQPRDRNAQAMFFVQEVPLEQLQTSNAQSGVRAGLQQMGLSYLGSREATARSGERFTVDVWQGQTQSGMVGVETTEFRHGDHAAVLMFMTPTLSRYQSPLGEILSNVVVDPQKARSVAPPRMHVGTAKRGESWQDIARRSTGNPGDAEEIANINGFDVREAPPAGMIVKLPEAVVPEE